MEGNWMDCDGDGDRHQHHHHLHHHCRCHTDMIIRGVGLPAGKWVHNSAPEGAVLASHQTPLSSRSSCWSYYVIMIKINLYHAPCISFLLTDCIIAWYFDNHDCIKFTTSLVNSSRCISLASLVSHFRVHPWLKTVLLIGVAMVQILFWGEQWG